VSQKLNKAIRQDIVDSVLAQTFNPRYTDLMKSQAAIGAQLYRLQVSKKDEDLMAALPSTYMHTNNERKVTVLSGDGVYVDLGHSTYCRNRNEQAAKYTRHRKSIQFPLGASKRFPLAVVHNNVDLHSNTTLGKAVIAARDGFVKLHNDMEVTERELNGLLNSVTTTRKLLEVWPEGIKHIPEVQRQAQLPAITGKAINAKLACMKKGDCKD